VCRADWERGPEGCGRRSEGRLGAACDACGGCGAGLSCVTDLANVALPANMRPFCTATCAADADCPEGGRCADLGGGLRACLAEPCACLEPHGDVVDEALALAGKDRCTAIFSRAMWSLTAPAIAFDPFRLSFYDAVHDEPGKALPWGRALVRDLSTRANAPTPVADVLERAAALVDEGVPAERAQFAPDAAAPLVEAVRAAYTAAGRNRFPEATVAQAVAQVPASLQRKAAAVILAEVAVYQARGRMLRASGASPALQGALADRVPVTMASDSHAAEPDMTDPEVQRLLSGGLDLSVLYAATRDLAATVENADFSAESGAMGFDVDISTPLGRVVLHDGGAQTLADGGAPILLLVDTGGDDRYEAPVAATSGLGYPVSVAIDVAGNDQYGYPGSEGEPELPGLPPADAAGRAPPIPPGAAPGSTYGPISRSHVGRQGSGVLGAGLLFDLGGSDRYTSLKLSQGAGVLGVGAIYDADGDDTYRCEQGCQGAGSYGIGLLVDRAGRDTYTGAQMVQGFAYVRGFGYLHDERGDDTYLALLGDADLGGVQLYPNAQNPGRSNTSLAQGAGFGRRADGSDGVFASGGIGILRDGGGTDSYTVDIFGQGTGFWFGTGILSDGGDGDDQYDGRWYNQGSDAHMALAFFFEEGGNDRYDQRVPILATAVGQGHDYSLGFFVDEAGNDTYKAPGLGLGAGNDNGIGFFLEGGGDDTYDAPDATTFGGAAIGNDRGGPYDSALCLGVFVDADGHDTYTQMAGDALVGDGKTWSLDRRHPDHKPGAAGAGLDLSGRRLDLP
jgi:hypothetical protein